MRLLHKPLSGVADWLSLAAAPTFAAMALLTAMSGSNMFCAGSPIGGMVPMYLLMGVFHVGPWLRLLAAARPTWRAHS